MTLLQPFTRLLGIVDFSIYQPNIHPLALYQYTIPLTTHTPIDYPANIAVPGKKLDPEPRPNKAKHHPGSLKKLGTGWFSEG